MIALVSRSGIREGDVAAQGLEGSTCDGDAGTGDQHNVAPPSRRRSGPSLAAPEGLGDLRGSCLRRVEHRPTSAQWHASLMRDLARRCFFRHRPKCSHDMLRPPVEPTAQSGRHDRSERIAAMRCSSPKAVNPVSPPCAQNEEQRLGKAQAVMLIAIEDAKRTLQHRRAVGHPRSAAVARLHEKA